MKKRRIKRLILYTAALIIGTSSLAYTIVGARDIGYSNYVSDTVDSIESDEFNVVAHRGFSSLEVENTYDSLALAASKSYVDAIEFDVRLTKDGKLILSHNNTLNINPFDFINVSSQKYDDLVNRDFSYFPVFSVYYPWTSMEDTFVRARSNSLFFSKYRLIGLSDAIKACQDKVILLDIKFNNDYSRLIRELKLELKDVDTSNIIVQSLDIKGINRIQEETDFNTQVLISNKSDLKYVLDFDSVGISSSLVNYDLINYLVTCDKRVMVWTINTAGEMDRVLKIVGDYYKDIFYITNYPDLVVTRLKEKEDKDKEKEKAIM